MTSMFLNNFHYAEVVRLLKQLHLLARENRDASDEAEAIRDEMDSHWYKLEPQEMALVKIISADLRMIEGKEVFRSVPPEQRTREWLGPKLAEAYGLQDWFTVLTLLRNGPDFLDPDRVAYLRGQCYIAIGHSDIGLLFLAYAAQLKPNDYSTILMNHLSQLGQIREAVALAENVLTDKNIPPDELIAASNVLCLSTRPMSDEERKPVLEKALSALLTAIQREGELSIEERSSEIRKQAYGILGQIYAWLGQVEKAHDAYNNALKIDPEDAEALTMRGMLLLKNNEMAAKQDFERAVKNHTVNVTPYLYLAPKALVQGDYQQCLSLCSHALRLTQRPSTLARILSWLAITNIYLGAEVGMIESLFERAMTFDPLNEEIRRNYDLFRERRSNAIPTSLSGWQVRLPTELMRQEATTNRSYAAV